MDTQKSYGHHYPLQFCTMQADPNLHASTYWQSILSWLAGADRGQQVPSLCTKIHHDELSNWAVYREGQIACEWYNAWRNSWTSNSSKLSNNMWIIWWGSINKSKTGPLSQDQDCSKMKGCCREGLTIWFDKDGWTIKVFSSWIQW